MTTFFHRAVALTMANTLQQLVDETPASVVYQSQWSEEQMTFTCQDGLIKQLKDGYPVYNITAYLLEDWDSSLLEVFLTKGEETLTIQFELTYIQQRHELTYSYYEARFDLNSFEDVYIHRMNEFTQTEVNTIRDQIISYIRDMNANRLLFLTQDISITEG